MNSNKVDYEQIKKNLQLYLDVAEEVKILNEELKKYNWLFVSPGIEYGDVLRFRELYEGNSINEDRIIEIFKQSFLSPKEIAKTINKSIRDLKSTRKFSFLIEKSVVLYLQKDFAGAISIIIPVIEGVIRNYITTETGKKPSEIMRKTDLLKGINLIEKHAVDSSIDFYNSKSELNVNQKKQVAKLIRSQRKIWFDMFREFLQNNLYLDTRGNDELVDSLNRHSIIHCFSVSPYYTESNYIKLYSCIRYFTSAFRIIESGLGFILRIRENDYLESMNYYEQIEKESIRLSKLKSSLFRKYEKTVANKP